MKITKESLKKIIAEEFENLNREVSTQDQAAAQAEVSYPDILKVKSP